MLSVIGITLFLVGCLISCSAREYEASERNKERRHREVMTKLTPPNTPSQIKKTKVTRRRFIKDAEGNIIGEEIIEEVEK